MSAVSIETVIGVEKSVERKEMTDSATGVVTVYAREVKTTTYAAAEYKTSIDGTDLPGVDVSSLTGAGTVHTSGNLNPITGKAVFKKQTVDYGSWVKIGQYAPQDNSE